MHKIYYLQITSLLNQAFIFKQSIINFVVVNPNVLIEFQLLILIFMNLKGLSLYGFS